MPLLAILACERGTPAPPQRSVIAVTADGADAAWSEQATAAFGGALQVDSAMQLSGHLHLAPVNNNPSMGSLVLARLDAVACDDARPLELELLLTGFEPDWEASGEQAGHALMRAAGQALRDTVVSICGDELVLANSLVEERGPVLVARLREVARRRATTLAPAVAEYLRSPDAGVRLAAAGTLAQLGAREHAGDLIAAIDLRAPRDAASMLPALARIGGTEARLFLQTVADGAEDPSLRQLAAELLPLTAAE